MAGNTDSKNKWQKENLDRISLTVPKGQKEAIQAHAAAHGKSLNGFINQAINRAIEHDRMVEHDSEKLIASIKEYKKDMDEQEIKELVVALAILKSQASGITDFFLSEIKPQESSKWKICTLK